MTQTLARIDGSTTALARDPADLAPRFVISLDDLKRQVADLERFKREIMREGEDFGVIPGTPKPTLLKPGAEKLTLVFGLAPTFVNVGKVEDWDGGFFHYEEQCVLTSKRTGDVVAAANGSANSKEPRYRWRKAERVCPICGKAAIIKGKEDYGGGWLCFRKKDGCGAKFQVGDPEIERQQVGNVENPEPYELVNTILKMAQKRALVAATLIATGGSGTWTMDIEDMPSMAGDPDIIDVPTRAPAAPQSAPANTKANMVTSDDHAMWKRWIDLKSEAERLGLKVEPLELPIGKPLLQAAGAKVREQVRLHGEVSVDHPRYQLLSERCEQVGLAGGDPAQFAVTLPAALSVIEEKIAAAEKFISDHDTVTSTDDEAAF